MYLFYLVVFLAKLDIYKQKEYFNKWKYKGCGFDNISKSSADILKTYILDKETEISYSRLNTLRIRLRLLAEKFENLYSVQDITKMIKPNLKDFFAKMRSGDIYYYVGQGSKREKRNYASVPDYVRDFKAFWHWYMSYWEDKTGETLTDITKGISTEKVKEKDFVYLTDKEIKKLASISKFDYKVMIWFIYDSGIRAPTELVNVKVSDLMLLDNGKFELDIRDEIAKGGTKLCLGRKIKLMYCNDLLKEYIQIKELRQSDYLFKITPSVVNQYLKRKSEKMFGKKKTKGGGYTDKFTLYDIRHSSACFWWIKYKSEKALKYRFGWKRSDKIYYYTKKIGMLDTITEDDLITDVDKSHLEKQIIEQNKKIEDMEKTIMMFKTIGQAIIPNVKNNEQANEMIDILTEFAEKNKLDYPMGELKNSPIGKLADEIEKKEKLNSIF